MKLSSFCFLIYDEATISGKKGRCIVALIYCSLKVEEEEEVWGMSELIGSAGSLNKEVH